MVRFGRFRQAEEIFFPCPPASSSRLQTALVGAACAADWLFLADHIVSAADVFADFHQRFSHFFQKLGHFILLFKYRWGGPRFFFT